MKLMSIKRIAAISVFLVSAVTVSAQETDSLFPEFSPDVDMKSSVPENSFSNRGIQFGGWTVPFISPTHPQIPQHLRTPSGSGEGPGFGKTAQFISEENTRIREPMPAKLSPTISSILTLGICRRGLLIMLCGFLPAGSTLR